MRDPGLIWRQHTFSERRKRRSERARSFNRGDMGKVWHCWDQDPVAPETWGRWRWNEDPPPSPHHSGGFCYLCPAPQMGGSRALAGAAAGRSVRGARRAPWCSFHFALGRAESSSVVAVVSVHMWDVGETCVRVSVCVCVCAATPLPASALGPPQAHGPLVHVRTLGDSQEC